MSSAGSQTFRRRLLGSTAFRGAAALGVAVALNSGGALADCNIDGLGGDLTNQSNVSVTCDTGGGSETTQQGDGTNEQVVFTVNTGALQIDVGTGAAIFLRSNNILTINGGVNSGGAGGGVVSLYATGPNTITVGAGGSVGATGASNAGIYLFGGNGDIVSNTIAVNGGGTVSGSLTNGILFNPGGTYVSRNNTITIGAGSTVFGDSQGLQFTGITQSNSITVDGDLSAACGCSIALSFFGDATGNTVTVNAGGRIGNDGVNYANVGIGVQGIATNNQVTINGGGLVQGQSNGIVMGGTGNTFTINGSLIQLNASAPTPLTSALFLGNATGNTITVGSGGMVRSYDGAGIAFFAAASNNTITIDTGGTVQGVSGIYFQGNANSNNITVNGALIADCGCSVALLFNGNAGSNTITVGSGGSITSNYGVAVQFNGATSGNSILVNGGGTISGFNTALNFNGTSNTNNIITVNGTVQGTYSAAGVAGISFQGGNSGNQITIGGGGTVAGIDYGIIFRNDATGNTITVNGTLRQQNAYSSNPAALYIQNGTGNTINVGATGVVDSYDGAGITMGGTATGNTITIAAGGLVRGNYSGIYFPGAAISNVINVNGSLLSNGSGSGAYGLGVYGNATGNIITVGAGGRIASTYNIGLAVYGTATNNTILVNAGGSITGYYGGMKFGAANNNLITIDGTVRGGNFGIYFDGDATGNTINVNGTLAQDLSCGCSTALYFRGTATNNTINVGATGAITATYGAGISFYNPAIGNNILVNAGGRISGYSGGILFQYTSSNNVITVNGTVSATNTGLGSGIVFGDTATSNRITIGAGGSVFGRLYGMAFSGDAIGNTITIDGALRQQSGLSVGVGLFMNTATNNTITVGPTGSIESEGTAVIMGPGSSGNTITVAAGGLVKGGYQGIYFFGSADNNILTVNGSVIQEMGCVCTSAIAIAGTATGNTITVGTTGVVSSASGAGIVMSDVGVGNVIGNAGLISGRTGILLDSSLAAGSLTLTNAATGIITGLDGNAFDARTSMASMFVTNAGLMNGNVVLGLNNDSLTLVTGQTITGTIDGGAGSNGLFLDGTGTASFTNTLVGNSFNTLTKQGTGIWTLTANQTFAGGTTVNAGSLLLGAGTTLTSNALVNSGGIFGGNGTLGGNLTLNGGTVSPGASIGTLTVTGNANLSNGTMLVEVDRASSDRLLVGGAATLTGGTVQFAYLEPLLSGSYTFLTSGGIGGQYSSVVLPPSLFVTGTVAYTPTSAIFNTTRTAFVVAATGENQQATGAALDRGIATTTGDSLSVIATLDALPSFAAAANAFGQMSGEIHTSFQTTGVQNAQQFAGAIRQHLRRDPVRGGGTVATASLASTSGYYANNELIGNQLAMASAGQRIDPTQIALGDIDPELGRARGTAWIRGFGLLGSADGAEDRATHDLGYRIAGVAGGADYALTRAFTLGVALGYANTEADLLGANADRARTDTVSGAIYGMWNSGSWFADASLGYAYDDYKTERRIIFGGLDRKADAKYHGREFFFDGEAGYRWRWGGFRIDPSVGLAWTNSHQSSFDETGANSLNLSADSRSINSVRASVGARVAYGVKMDDGLVLVPEARLRYQRELGDEQRTLDARFAGINGGTFTSRGAEPARDAALIGVGVTANLDPGLALFVDYDADIRSNANAHAITGGLRFTW